jgi:hypothetical protein
MSQSPISHKNNTGNVVTIERQSGKFSKAGKQRKNDNLEHLKNLMMKKRQRMETSTLKLSKLQNPSPTNLSTVKPNWKEELSLTGTHFDTYTIETKNSTTGAKK